MFLSIQKLQQQAGTGGIKATQFGRRPARDLRALTLEGLDPGCQQRHMDQGPIAGNSHLPVRIRSMQLRRTHGR